MREGAAKPTLSQRFLKPEKVLALGFLGLILLGGALLALPAASAGGRSVGLLGGLFTATSAVCVTGLTVLDVGVDFSLFGQIVLIILIQVGGLGFMAFATLGMVAIGRRISLRNRMLIRDAMNQNSLSGMVRLTLSFFAMAMIIETLGACLLAIRLVPIYGAGRGIWYSVFHSISAFCNAGFDLFGGYRSLLDYQRDPVVMLTISLLIILGGLGFSVMLECVSQRFHFRKLSLHGKLTLIITGALLVAYTVLVALIEWTNPDTLGIEGMTFGDKLVNSFFQAVTFRTAGFAGLDQAKLTDTSKLLGVMAMFIGASPASTGGGVKTTTVGVVLLMAAAVIRGRDHISIFGKKIAMDTARRATTIIMIGVGTILICTCAISLVEPNGKFGMLDLLFETTSAFSTTGLSAIGTPTLSPFSKWLLMPLMYFGRVGPLTLAFALANRMEHHPVNRIHYPEEKIMIG